MPSADEFEQAYAARSGLTVESLRAMGRVVLPCSCGEPECEGWQSASRDDLVRFKAEAEGWPEGWATNFKKSVGEARMICTESQRQQISDMGKGKVVQSLEWSAEPDGSGYWVMTFEDESEICFRFMAELVEPWTWPSKTGHR